MVIKTMEQLNIDAIEPNLLPEATSSKDRFERYVNGNPPTVGVLYGPITEAEDGIYISPDIVKDSAEELPELAEVEFMPGALLGTAASHHSVVFWDAVLVVGEEVQSVEVAIKELGVETGLAEKEHDIMLAVRERGIDTFQPLAIAKDGESAYLVTFRRDEVTSLDNENWTHLPGELRYEEEVIPNLHFLADSIALLHAKGVFHGDAQPKNFARTDTGNPVMFDFEDATIASNDQELIELIEGSSQDESKALSDVWHCWYAMTHPLVGTEGAASKVFLEGLQFEKCMKEFELNFLNPYLESLKQYIDPVLIEKINIENLRQSIYMRVAHTS